MNKKFILIAFVFAALTLALGSGAWLYQNYKNSLYAGGEPTFARTKNKMVHLGKIQISSPDGAEVTLYRNNGLWHFKEAKNYFANIEQLNNLLNMFNDSEIVLVEDASERTIQKYDLSEQSGILLQTYDLDDSLLDKLIIGRKNKDNTCYARLPQTEKHIYRISSCATFSADAADWIPYPLLTLPYHLLERIKTAQREFSYKDIDRQIIESVDMRRLLLILGALDYQGIMLKEEFADDTDLNSETRELEVELVDGLVYIFTIHHSDDIYWLEIAMKPGKVARKSVRPFIENNRQYYDRWLFQLDPYQGKIMFDFAE